MLQILISESNVPADWMNRLVIFGKKNEDLRLCLNPLDLNEIIIREHCVIPSLSDLSSKLRYAKVFSVLNLKNRFLYLKNSKWLTFGTYCFNRLPFEVIDEAEICQKWNIKVFRSIENVCIYLDDLLIFGNTEVQHDSALQQVLDLAVKNNINFRKNKIQYKSQLPKLHIFFRKNEIS